jgi:hypothetical protein
MLKQTEARKSFTGHAIEFFFLQALKVVQEHNEKEMG